LEIVVNWLDAFPATYQQHQRGEVII